VNESKSLSNANVGHDFATSISDTSLNYPIFFDNNLSEALDLFDPLPSL